MSGKKQLTLHSFFKKSKASANDIEKKITWLLDAIKHIKQQKQRPDRERICSYLQSHHSLTAQEVSLLLDHCVTNEILATAVTRGNTDKLTYMIVDSAGGVMKSPYRSGAESEAEHVAASPAPIVQDDKRIIHDNSDITVLMAQAVKALKQTGGSSLNDIAEYILTCCDVELNNGVDLIRLVKANARQAVRTGMLAKSKDNLYRVARCYAKSVAAGVSGGSSSKSKDKSKVKPMPICSFCLGDEKKNRTGQAEELISCSNCGQSGHPSCLKFSDSLTAVVRQRVDWQCLDCKRCVECSVTKRSDNNMLICDRCDRSYHLHCCKPALKKPPDGTWVCHICKAEVGSTGESLSKPGRRQKLPVQPNGKVKFGLIRKRYEFKRMCPTTGCDGSGNVNSTLSNHRRQTACPLLSKEERALLRQQRAAAGADSDSDNESHGGSSKASTTNSGTAETNNSSSTGDLPQPKGLVDGLTQFFTPSDKRKSRVSMSSLLTASQQQQHQDGQAVKQPKAAPTTSQAAANRLLKRSKLVQRSKAQTEQLQVKQKSEEATADNPEVLVNSLNDKLPGAHQLKGLLDGMTKYFTPTGHRKRSVPLYAPPPRRRKDLSSIDTPDGAAAAGSPLKSGGEESDGAGILSDGYKSDGTAIYMDSIDKDNLPSGVLERDYKMFRRSQREAQSQAVMGGKTVIEHGKRYPPVIEFGKYEIETWYSSPYPQEYAQLPKLYICEFCLKYMKTRSILERHMNKCGLTHPPANEIYRKDNLSVFEVDGNSNKIYCQNLCLLAKLFLDHKTLYYDVEPFLFYVLTINDADGCHFVGYFSKEKHCQQKYNVSCITSLPQHQRKGYGRFLIDFSYLLSRIEGTAGSPEKPLSELGKVSYQSYWRSRLLELLHQHRNDSSLTIKTISQKTGMCAHDIAATLQDLKVIETNTAQDVVMSLDTELLDRHMSRLSGSRRIVIDEECLRWTPVISSHSPPVSSPDKSSSSPDKSAATTTRSLTRIEQRLSIDPDVEVEPEPIKSPPLTSSHRASRSSNRTRQASLSKTATVNNNNNSTAGRKSPVTSPTRSAAARAADQPPADDVKSSPDRRANNGSGGLRSKKRRKRSTEEQQQPSSSDDEEGAVNARPSKPPPHKRRRGSCKEEKVSGHKGGSPSTPEKKGRWSSRNNTSTRSGGRTRSTVRSNNSKGYDKSSAADEKRNTAANKCSLGADGEAMDEDSCRWSDVSSECEYDASASDTDSGNSEIEQYSHDSDNWSPTAIRPATNSDSGNTTMTEDRSSYPPEDGSDTKYRPSAVSGSTQDVSLNSKTCTESLLEDMTENYEKMPCETAVGCLAASKLPAATVSQRRNSSITSETVQVQTKVPMDHLPIPQTAGVVTSVCSAVVDIDPATLCFESPISLSSNDTSLNTSTPAAECNHTKQQQARDIQDTIPSEEQQQQQQCGGLVSMGFPSEQPADSLLSDPSAACLTAANNNNNIGDSSVPAVYTNQEDNNGQYHDTGSDCFVDASGGGAGYSSSVHYLSDNNMNRTGYQSANGNMMASATVQSAYGGGNYLSDQMTSPQSVHSCDYTVNSPQQMQQQRLMLQPSPLTVNPADQQHLRQMYPPTQHSPHHGGHLPTSPMFQPNSPHVTPHSPLVTPQSPHYQQQQQQQQQVYPAYRNRTGSLSSGCGGLSVPMPSDMTPPPATPSPTKHTPPDHQQQQNQQRYHPNNYMNSQHVPLKSPSITMDGRGGMYNAHQMMNGASQHPQSMFTGYPSQTQFSNQHLLTTAASQCIDPQYLSNRYQMQLNAAQAAAAAAAANQSHMYGGQMTPQPNSMYGGGYYNR